MKGKQNIEYKLKAIEVLDINLVRPKTLLASKTTFQFNIKMEHKIKLEESLIIVVSTINILNNENNLATYTASCVFELSNLGTFNNPKTNLPEFPQNLLEEFNAITISTVRGLMFSSFKGTFLHNAILPVIDSKSFTVNK